jgi:hypothetical protein
MMKEVDPVACTRNCVFRESSTIAITTKLPNAHHPGNGNDVALAKMPRATAMAVTIATRR